MKKLNLCSFEEAKEYAKSLNLQSSTQWKTFCKNGNKRCDVPASPNSIYREKGWVSWGDFLDTKNITNKQKSTAFRSYESARQFVRSLSLQGSLEWAAYCRSGNRPHNVPAAPYIVYKGKGWISWDDWLGGNSVFRSFESAREFVHSLNFQNTYEWFAYAKSEGKPKDIPGSPANYYRGSGWVSWYDWLGKARSRKKVYMPFEEARIFVRSLGLRTMQEWTVYAKSGKRPHDIPSSPNIIYKGEGWKSIKDWLGTENVNGSKYRPFDQAREFARSLALKNQQAWLAYSRSGERPRDIPSSPNTVYKDNGWVSWKDWRSG